MKMNVECIEKILNRLLHTTDNQLRKVQMAKCPHYIDLDIEYTNNDIYIYDEIKTKSKNMIFKINNIDYIKKVSRIHMYSGPILDLINRNIIKPIILFINNEMIDFDNINLITDTRNSYLEVKNFGNIDYKIGNNKFKELTGDFKILLPKVYPELIDKMYLDIVCSNKETIKNIKFNGVKLSSLGSLPSDIINTDMNNILEFTCNKSKIYNIEFKNSEISLISINDIKTIMVPDGMIVNKTTNPEINKNTLMFLSGMHIDNSEFINIPLECKVTSIDIMYKNNNVSMYSDNIFNSKFINTYQDTLYKIYPETLFIFNKGYQVFDYIDRSINVFELPEHMDIYYRYYYFKENISNDNITRYSKVTNLVENILNGNVSDNLDMIKEPLDFLFQLDIPREERIYNLVEIICKYNSYLLQDYIDYHSNIEVFYYTGKEIKDLSKFENDMYIMNKLYKYDSINKFGIIMFKNGILYDTKIYESRLNLEISFESNIDDNDIFTLMVFNKVNNNSCTINIYSEKEDKLLGNYIPIKDIRLFTDTINNHIYKYLPDEKLQYSVEAQVIDKGRGNVNFIMDDFFYNRDLKVVSSRQFIHKTLIVDNNNISNNLCKILLPDEFKYCDNKDQFMIFRNKRKMDNNYAYVCLNKHNLPFDKRFIHLTKKCQIGDIIDIIYIPEPIDEVSLLEEKIESNGYIELKKYDLGYNLDTKNSSIFINGKRISNYDVEYISSEIIRLKKDVQSYNNIHIFKHIGYKDTIFELIRTLEDSWDKMIKSMTRDELDELFNINTVITDTEKNIMDNSFTRQMVLYEIIRRYWLIKGNVVRVENPIFYIYEKDGVLVLPIDSSIEMIDVVDIIKDKFVNDDMIVNYGGEDSLPLDASDILYPYDDLNESQYMERYPPVNIICNSNINDGVDVIDLILENANDSMVVEIDEHKFIPIDASKNYMIKVTDDNSFDEYCPIDASIIVPYFYDKLITVGDGIIRPIPIDASMKQINPIPGLEAYYTHFNIFRGKLIISDPKYYKNIKSMINIPKYNNDINLKGRLFIINNENYYNTKGRIIVRDNILDKKVKGIINIVSKQNMKNVSGKINLPIFNNINYIRGSIYNKTIIIVDKEYVIGSKIVIKNNKNDKIVRCFINILPISKIYETNDFKAKIKLPIFNNIKYINSRLNIVRNNKTKYVKGSTIISLVTKNKYVYCNMNIPLEENIIKLKCILKVSKIIEDNKKVNSIINIPKYQSDIKVCGSLSTIKTSENNNFKGYIKLPLFDNIVSTMGRLNIPVSESSYKIRGTINVIINKVTFNTIPEYAVVEVKVDGQWIEGKEHYLPDGEYEYRAYVGEWKDNVEE